MDANTQGMIFTTLAAIVSAYLAIRLKRWSWPAAVVSAWLILAIGVWAVSLHPDRMHRSSSLLPAYLMVLAVWAVLWCTPFYAVRQLVILIKYSREPGFASRRRKILTATVLLLAMLEVPFILVAPRLACCYGNLKIADSSPRVKGLDSKPKVITIAGADAEPLVSVGYAEVYIDPNRIARIEVLNHTVHLDCNQAHVLFLPPYVQTLDTYSSTQRDFGAMGLSFQGLERPLLGQIIQESDSGYAQLLRESIEDPFADYVAMLNTIPLSTGEVFRLDRRSAQRYLGHLLQKSVLLTLMRFEDMTVFNAPHGRGIIATRPDADTFNVFVFKNESNITQGIEIRSTDVNLRQSLLDDITASHRFLISQVPDPNALESLVVGNVSQHPRYKPSATPVD